MQHLRFHQRLFLIPPGFKTAMQKGAGYTRAFLRYGAMPFVQSAALIAVHYDPAHRELSVTFRDSGRIQVYRDVPPEIYDRLLFAPSLGGFFNAHIRDHFAFRES